MTSSNGNIFRVTGPLCGEFTGPREFPAQRPVTRSFDVLLICVWINGWVNNREAGDLRRNQAHYDVIVMATLKRHCFKTNGKQEQCKTAAYAPGPCIRDCLNLMNEIPEKELW